MLQALQEKRRTDWEKRKKEVISKYGDKIKQVVAEEPESEPELKLKPKPVAAPEDKPIGASGNGRASSKRYAVPRIGWIVNLPCGIGKAASRNFAARRAARIVI